MILSDVRGTAPQCAVLVLRMSAYSSSSIISIISMLKRESEQTDPASSSSDVPLSKLRRKSRLRSEESAGARTYVREPVEARQM